MQLLLKDRPLLTICDNGTCEIIDFDHLPFALRRDPVTFVEFIEWASSRTLSMGRSYAKEILNALRLSQTNRYAVCRACRGLSLEDSYWLRQELPDLGDCQSFPQSSVTFYHRAVSLRPEHPLCKKRGRTREHPHPGAHHIRSQRKGVGPPKRTAVPP